jgi:hypothetical protein
MDSRESEPSAPVMVREQSGQIVPIEKKRRGGRPRGFALTHAHETARGRNVQSVKRQINRMVRLGRILGDDLLNLKGTSLNKGVELEALAELPVAERKELIARAVSGEKVSARTRTIDLRGRYARAIAEVIARNFPPETWSTVVVGFYGAGAANIAIELKNKVGESTHAGEQ